MIFSKFKKSICDIFLRPFTTEILYTLVLWLIACGYLGFHQLRLGNYNYSIYLILLAFLLSVISSFIVSANKQAARILKPVVLFLFFVLSVVDVFCVLTFETHVSADFIASIINTNVQETKDFFSTFVRWYHLVIIFIVAVSIYLVVYKVHFSLKGKWTILPVSVFLLAVIATCHNPTPAKHEFVNGYNFNNLFDDMADLSLHLTHPNVVESDSIHPRNVIIILGESFTRRHSSLYGYEKKTNPLLSKYMEQGNLVLFKDALSPATNTISAFKYILNTHVLSDSTDKRWYDYTNIVEAFNTVGYKTFWLSNQSQRGVWDNSQCGHSKLCDEICFNDRETERYDGFLIDAQKNMEYDNRNFIFYHLIGQHWEYSNKYPEDFAIFNVSDYMDHPKHQRKALMDYDNATLYNDFVVSSIIDFHKSKDAIIFYFPDHGQDIYVTNPQYAGHAKINPESQKVGKEIPFMVFLSDSLMLRNPTLKAKAESLSEEPFCTDHFIFLAMKLAGFEIKE